MRRTKYLSALDSVVVSITKCTIFIVSPLSGQYLAEASYSQCANAVI